MLPSTTTATKSDTTRVSDLSQMTTTEIFAAIRQKYRDLHEKQQQAKKRERQRAEARREANSQVSESNGVPGRRFPGVSWFVSASRPTCRVEQKMTTKHPTARIEVVSNAFRGVRPAISRLRAYVRNLLPITYPSLNFLSWPIDLGKVLE